MLNLLLNNPLFFALYNIILKLICLLVAIAYYTLAERKIMAAAQRRHGPDVVGFWGLLQPLADGLKLFAKEFILPTHANSSLFVIAPLAVFALALSSWMIMPFYTYDASEIISIRDTYTLALRATPAKVVSVSPLELTRVTFETVPFSSEIVLEVENAWLALCRVKYRCKAVGSIPMKTEKPLFFQSVLFSLLTVRLFLSKITPFCLFSSRTKSTLFFTRSPQMSKDFILKIISSSHWQKRTHMLYLVAYFQKSNMLSPLTLLIKTLFSFNELNHQAKKNKDCMRRRLAELDVFLQQQHRLLASGFIKIKDALWGTFFRPLNACCIRCTFLFRSLIEHKIKQRDLRFRPGAEHAILSWTHTYASQDTAWQKEAWKQAAKRIPEPVGPDENLVYLAFIVLVIFTIYTLYRLWVYRQSLFVLRYPGWRNIRATLTWIALSVHWNVGVLFASHICFICLTSIRIVEGSAAIFFALLRKWHASFYYFGSLRSPERSSYFWVEAERALIKAHAKFWDGIAYVSNWKILVLILLSLIFSVFALFVLLDARFAHKIFDKKTLQTKTTPQSIVNAATITQKWRKLTKTRVPRALLKVLVRIVRARRLLRALIGRK